MITFPKHLLEGYSAFATQRLPAEQNRYRELSVKGQLPEVMVIGCCDSRVSPEVIFDVGPGELFVVRNIANLVPVYQPDGNAHGVSAALEYAVTVLKVKHIVMLGHAQCGGIRAFVDKIEPLTPGDFIGKWMQMFIKPGEVVEQRDARDHGAIRRAHREGRGVPQPGKPDDVPVRAQGRSRAARCSCTAPISASRRERCSCWTRRARNSRARGAWC